MTQTVHRVKNFKDGATVSVYYHPNNFKAPIENCRWAYDAEIVKNR